YASTPTTPVRSKTWSSVTFKNLEHHLFEASYTGSNIDIEHLCSPSSYVDHHRLRLTVQNDSQIPLSSPLPSYNQLPGQHHVPQPSKNVDAATVHVQRHSPIVSHPVPPHNHSPLRTIDDIVHHLAPHHQVIITDTPTGRQDQANSIRSPHAQFCAGIIAANTLHRISFAF
ncbi:hypothetical protein PLEOSDRAFT_172843, partial [Pleurotus ostreatus PC15]